MSREIRYDVGQRHHNGQFVGWAVFKVHPSCYGECCPKTVAEFYGKKARTYALWFKANLEREAAK